MNQETSSKTARAKKKWRNRYSARAGFLPLVSSRGRPDVFGTLRRAYRRHATTPRRCGRSPSFCVSRSRRAPRTRKTRRARFPRCAVSGRETCLGFRRGFPVVSSPRGSPVLRPGRSPLLSPPSPNAAPPVPPRSNGRPDGAPRGLHPPRVRNRRPRRRPRVRRVVRVRIRQRRLGRDAFRRATPRPRRPPLLRHHGALPRPLVRHATRVHHPAGPHRCGSRRRRRRDAAYDDSLFEAARGPPSWTPSNASATTPTARGLRRSRRGRCPRVSAATTRCPRGWRNRTRGPFRFRKRAEARTSATSRAIPRGVPGRESTRLGGIERVFHRGGRLVEFRGDDDVRIVVVAATSRASAGRTRRRRCGRCRTPRRCCTSTKIGWER